MKTCALSTIFLFAIFFPNSAASQDHQIPEIPRINAEMALLKYKAGNVIIVDAMNKETFAKYHIFGAINLPNDGAEDIKRIMKANLPIPINREIIVYCD